MQGHIVCLLHAKRSFVSGNLCRKYIVNLPYAHRYGVSATEPRAVPFSTIAPLTLMSARHRGELRIKNLICFVADYITVVACVYRYTVICVCELFEEYARQLLLTHVLPVT